jgi:hypothetical protein
MREWLQDDGKIEDPPDEPTCEEEKDQEDEKVNRPVKKKRTKRTKK